MSCIHTNHRLRRGREGEEENRIHKGTNGPSGIFTVEHCSLVDDDGDDRASVQTVQHRREEYHYESISQSCIKKRSTNKQRKKKKER